MKEGPVDRCRLYTSTYLPCPLVLIQSNMDDCRHSDPTRHSNDGADRIVQTHRNIHGASPLIVCCVQRSNGRTLCQSLLAWVEARICLLRVAHHDFRTASRIAWWYASSWTMLIVYVLTSYITATRAIRGRCYQKPIRRTLASEPPQAPVANPDYFNPADSSLFAEEKDNLSEQLIRAFHNKNTLRQ